MFYFYYFIIILTSCGRLQYTTKAYVVIVLLFTPIFHSGPNYNIIIHPKGVQEDIIIVLAYNRYNACVLLLLFILTYIWGRLHD